MPCEDAECLVSRLADRFALLEALADRDRPKGELEATLDVSRSTVDRAVRSLEESGVVTRRGGAVALTTFGRVALDGYTSFRRGLEALDRARPMLPNPEDEATPIPFGFFQGADVVTATRSSPHRPVVAFQQFLQDVDSVESVVTGILPEYVRSYRTQVVEADLEADLVVEPAVLDDLLATYWEPLEEAIETGRVRIYEAAGTPPASVKIGSGETTEAALLAYGPQGVGGFARTTSAEGVRWARSIVEASRADATLVAPLSES